MSDDFAVGYAGTIQNDNRSSEESQAKAKKSLLINIAFGFLAICGQVIQNIALPLWIDSATVKENCTWENSTHNNASCPERSIDSYFVYTFACINFVVIFGLILLVMKLIRPSSLTKDDLAYPQRDMILVGMFDALNGVMVVFASSPRRTPPYLQAILANFVIPWTVFFRFALLRKVPTLLKGICALTVMLSLFVCVLPNIIPSLGADTTTQSQGISAILWPMIFMLGFTPAAVMNVIEERVLQDSAGSKKINMIYFLFCTSSYQLLTAMVLFWVDIVPWYGNAHSIQELGDSWAFGFKCFFGGEGCSPDTGIRGSTFILAYTVSYLGGGLLLRYTEGAVLLAVVTSVVTPLGFIFWSLFVPDPFHFAPEANIKTWFAIASLALMVPAIFFYNYQSKAEKEEDKTPLHHEDQLEENDPWPS